jgi:hypothetical protein
MSTSRPAELAALVAAVLIGAAVFGYVDGAHGASGAVYPDVYGFAQAGSQLVSSGWSHTYVSSWLQAGPLELLLAWFAHAIGGGARGFAIVLDVVSIGALTAAAVVFFERRTAAIAIFVAGAFALGLPRAGYEGHPAELIVAALWLLAARAARNGTPLLAGLLVGLSACFELYGLVGVTVLTLAPELKRSLPALAVAVALPVASLLPFIARGDFHMFDFQWQATSGLPRLLLGYQHPFTWQLRVAQGAIVIVAGAALARFVRRTPESVWIVPAATVLLKIVLDPIDPSYYWTTPAALLLVGAAASAGALLLTRREARRAPRSLGRAAGRPSH